MIFRFSRLILLIVCATVGGILPAHAQKLRHGQPIFFAPAQDGSVSNTPTPSMLPRSPALPTFQTIEPRFDVMTAPASPRVMMPAFSAAEVARLKEAADRQKNWALMTPEE